jgi:hypothetical protein
MRSWPDNAASVYLWRAFASLVVCSFAELFAWLFAELLGSSVDDYPHIQNNRLHEQQ